MKRFILSILLVLCGSIAYAQNPQQGEVVSACGTPGRTYTAGTPGVITLDTNGNLCFSGGGGGGAIIVVPPASTPAAFSGAYTIAAGTTAQQLEAASGITNSCSIVNPSTSTEQGIATAESLFVNFVTTATLLSGGTTIELLPGTGIGCPPRMTTAISVNATTTGHKFDGMRW